MARREQLSINKLTLTGLIEDASGNIIFARGTAVPSAVAGYAIGGLFADSVTGKLHQNVGTAASCTFNSIGDIIAGEITLATGSILLGTAGVAAAIDGKGDTKILIGNGTTMASFALTGGVVMTNGGVTTVVTNANLTGDVISVGNAAAIAAGVIVNADISDTAAISRTKQSTAAKSKIQEAVPATIATTGNTDSYVIAGETGALVSIDFSGVDALAANDTNYITWSITNLGQAGAGSTAMLAVDNLNTTKATGGAAVVANGKKSLVVHGTAANLDVTAGDRLLIRAAASGTLANTVTFPRYCLGLGGTT